MKQRLLCLTIVLLHLAARHDAVCAPPDKVANSPIPSLEQPKQKTAWKAPNSLVSLVVPTKQLQPKANPEQLKREVAASAQDSVAPDYESKPIEIWNSPEMREARAVVEEFCKRAAQTSPQEGEQFLDRLSQLTYEEMQDWLDRFQIRRQSVYRGHEVGKLARLLNVERSLGKLQARRQAAQNIAELRRQAAAARTAQTIEQPFVMIPIDVSGMSQLSYNPMEAVVDPSSPRGSGRKVAAAMSLPGDLPRSDPRNYIRGEAGVDFGEWATTKNAVPPALAPPPVATSPTIGDTTATSE